MNFFHRFFYTLSALLLFQTGAAEQAWSLDLTELSLEELMDVDVSLVSRKAQSLSTAPAAISVISREDLRRSGATSIAEALRLVPGLHVARIDANKWAVTSRGFNSRFANKLLVQLDGRSVYTSTFSGVYWEAQDVWLEDVEQIEVVRGPGAALWGANAVNGIINIVSKKAVDTRGLLVRAGGGTEERGFGGVRYGGSLGEAAHYRAYLKYFDRDQAVDASGQSAGDAWTALHGGARLDWAPSLADEWTFQGALYQGQLDNIIKLPVAEAPFILTGPDDIDMSGGHLLGRWEHRFSPSSDWAGQVFYDWTERKEFFDDTRHTFDLDIQHHFALSRMQEIVWGGGYRFTHSRINDSFAYRLDRNNSNIQLFNVFAQDEITLVPERFRLILGSKFEHNKFTGLEIQPGARLLWDAHPQHVLWGAASRAVRTPSRGENDGQVTLADFPLLPAQLPEGTDAGFLVVKGNRGFDAEELNAFEAGYRLQAGRHLFVDLATFYNVYHNLRSSSVANLITETAGSASFLILPVLLENGIEGETYGLELSVNGQVAESGRFHAHYTYLEMALDGNLSDLEEGSAPHHQFRLGAHLDPLEDWSLDGSMRYVGELPELGVDDYVDLDMRLGYEVNDQLEVALVGRNLLDGRHAEFTSQLLYIAAAEVERSLYGVFRWGF